VQRRLEAQVLGAGEEGIEGGLLKRSADDGAHLGAFLQNVVPAHRGGARGRGQQGGKHVNGGRLAGAVGAEEAVHLAGLDAQVDPVNRPRPLLELPDEVSSLDGGFSHDRPMY
jgi:hypothetical protein